MLPYSKRVKKFKVYQIGENPQPKKLKLWITVLKARD
jgi:hypothetical protein